MYSVRISQFQGKYIQNTEQNSQKYLVRSTPSTSSKKVSRSMDEENQNLDLERKLILYSLLRVLAKSTFETTSK